jgi:hypothetical protein
MAATVLVVSVGASWSTVANRQCLTLSNNNHVIQYITRLALFAFVDTFRTVAAVARHAAALIPAGTTGEIL